jgi:hypothetical protein
MTDDAPMTDGERREVAAVIAPPVTYGGPAAP